MNKRGGSLLKDLIDKTAIIKDDESEDWESAIRKASIPLIKNKKILPDYPENIIKGAKLHGPYFVVAPGIAIPHARPEEGALEKALGISILKKPVSFLDSPNNPVKYLFTLSMTSSQGHLEALAQLVELLEKKEFLDCLDKAKNSETIYKFINEWSRK